MKGHDPGRLAVVLVAVVCFVISLVFNALAVVGFGKEKNDICHHFFSFAEHNKFIVVKTLTSIHLSTALL